MPLLRSQEFEHRQIELAIDVLERAVVNHTKWLQCVHESVICGEPADKDIVAENAHQNCKLGQWYYNDATEIFNNFIEFIVNLNFYSHSLIQYTLSHTNRTDSASIPHPYHAYLFLPAQAWEFQVEQIVQLINGEFFHCQIIANYLVSQVLIQKKVVFVSLFISCIKA